MVFRARRITFLNLSNNPRPDYNQCQCLPKAELKTKTNPNGPNSVAVWVRFRFHLDSLEKHLMTLTVFTRSRSYRESEHEPVFSNLQFFHSRSSYLYCKILRLFLKVRPTTNMGEKKWVKNGHTEKPTVHFKNEKWTRAQNTKCANDGPSTKNV